MRVFPLFSPEDQDLVRPEGWAVMSGGYAGLSRYISRARNEYTVPHRVVLARKLGRGLMKEEVCDHINRNKLDNRRENLRATTAKGNVQNRGQFKANKSGFRGVFKIKVKPRCGGQWRAHVGVWGRTLDLGRFSVPELAGMWAARARRELGYLDNA